jgi:hypothetical protein
MQKKSETHLSEMEKVKREFDHAWSAIIHDAWNMPRSHVTSIKSAIKQVRRCKNWSALFDTARTWQAWVKAALAGQEKKRALLHLKRILDIADDLLEEDFNHRKGLYVAPDRTESVETGGEPV